MDRDQLPQRQPLSSLPHQLVDLFELGLGAVLCEGFTGLHFGFGVAFPAMLKEFLAVADIAALQSVDYGTRPIVKAVGAANLSYHISSRQTSEIKLLWLSLYLHR